MGRASFDVAVIGGGPAGSIAATALALAGRSVAVFEREKFPRFHIGESLLPFSMDAFERFGILQKLDAEGFIRKYGAEITSGCGSGEIRFYFKDGFRSKTATAFQVERSRFDKILLDHARECGAHVREETSVEDIALSPGRPKLTVKAKSGSLEEIETEYLLDCSGRHSVLGTRLGLKREYAGLQKFAVYAHYVGAQQPSGIDGTLTRMVRGKDHWFWIIPLSSEKISVGVVMDTQRYRSLRRSPAEVLELFLTEQPIFSSGVFLAILSGEKAAEAIDRALTAPHQASKLFARYERQLAKIIRLYLKFVYSWYRQEFVETVLAPREFFQVVPAVNAVLAGNVGRSFALRWRIWLFHLIVTVQRRFHIFPRLSLAPKTS
jgi:flavin-dependent dehydrogenase